MHGVTVNTLNIINRRTVRPMIKKPRHVTTLDTPMRKRKLFDVMKSGFWEVTRTKDHTICDVQLGNNPNKALSF
jgi:hypothetical protein